jgi:hypothetical protein
MDVPVPVSQGKRHKPLCESVSRHPWHPTSRRMQLQ